VPDPRRPVRGQTDDQVEALPVALGEPRVLALVFLPGADHELLEDEIGLGGVPPGAPADRAGAPSRPTQPAERPQQLVGPPGIRR